MPHITLDLSEAQSSEPLPDDTYRCTVKEFDGPKKGPKAAYLTVILSVSEGEHEGREFWHNMPITGKGAGIFADFLSKLTGEEIDVDELEELDVDTEELEGLEIDVVSRQQEYPEGSGDYRHNVHKFLSVI